MEAIYWTVFPIKLQTFINNALFPIFFELMKYIENDNLSSGQYRFTDIATVSWHNPNPNPVRVVSEPKLEPEPLG